MTKYRYKDFDTVYDVIFSIELNQYEARGAVIRMESGKLTYRREFRTEDPTLKGAEKEIKRLMKDFIDFEWQQFKLVHEDDESIEPNSIGKFLMK